MSATMHISLEHRMIRNLQPCAALGVALALAFAPRSTRAAGLTTQLSMSAFMLQPPTKSERRAVTAVYQAAEKADQDGDWDAFLDTASEAMQDVPERESSHLSRSEISLYVGTWRIEKRSEAQLARSVEILEAYVTDLHDAYGVSGQLSTATEDAHGYIKELRRRLDELQQPAASPAAAIVSPPPPTVSSDTGVKRRERARLEPLVVSGSVLAGAGAVLAISGIAYFAVVRSRYVDLRDQYQEDPGAVSDREEVQAWRRLPTSLAFIVPGTVLVGLGVGLLVAGVRRKRHDGSARSAFVPAGLRVTF